MKKFTAALVAVLCCAIAHAQQSVEVGAYPTAAPLTGTERILADQNGITVNIQPVQITSYLQTSNAIYSLLPNLVNSYCLSNNGTALQWIPCSNGISSIGLSMPSGFTVTGSPLTANGTLSVTTSLSGPIKGTGTGFAAATSSDLIGLFTGCSGTEYLGADGACHPAIGSGTVTSVALAVPSWLSITGSPVTSSGTMTLAGASGQSTHQFLGTGSTGTLGLTSISASDLPSTINSNTTGNASSATALAASPTLCTAGQAAGGILANGNATGCFTPSGSGNVSTSGTTAQYDIPVFTNGTAITGIAPSATVGEALISNGSVANPSFSASLAGVTSVNGTTIPATSTLLVSGGALGTPSSGTLTNATGLPFSAIVSGVNASGVTMTVGNGSLLTSSGTGIVDSNELNGGAVPASATVLGSNASNQIVAAATTGTGSVVLATSPTLVTPNLGTPSAINLSNATALPCTALPAFTGDATTTAGSCATIVSKVNGASWPALVSGKYLTNDGTNLSWGTPPGSMVYPGPGIAVSTGSAWGTPINGGSNTIVGNAGSGQAALTPSQAIGILNSGAANTTGCTGTGYTFVIGDENGEVNCSGTSAQTVTIPPNASVAFPTGTLLTVQETGTGVATISPGSGVTVTSAAYGSSTSLTYSLGGAYGFIQIQKTGTDTWNVIAWDTPSNQKLAVLAPEMQAYLAASTQWIGSGCTGLATQTGGPFAGTFTQPATACSTITVTMNGATGFTDSAGYACTMGDETQTNATTPSFIPTWVEASSTSTTATFKIPSAAQVASDVLSFACHPRSL